MINMKKNTHLVFIFLCFLSIRATAGDYPASLFGIRPDGITLNTRSIQFAIDFIQHQGGGRLVFQVGRYLTGSIHLKSGVTLDFEEGSVLLGSANPLDYDKELYTALILATNEKQIGITGKGVIDGQGGEVAMSLIKMIHSGIIKDPLRNDRPNEGIRPMLIDFRSCENIQIVQVTLKNSASWVQTYDQCRSVQIEGIRVDSKAFWNNDGIDIVDCDSVSVTHSFIDAADDGICLKSHDEKQVCSNILIRDCQIRSSANAIKFGTASYGGFSHIRILHNRVYDTFRSAVALEAVDGGFIDDVLVDSLQATNTGNAVFLRLGQRIPGRKSRLENVKFKNVTIEIARGKADSGYAFEGPIEDQPRNISPLVIAGLPDAPIKNISFTNISIHYPGGGNSFIFGARPDLPDSIPELPAHYPEFSMFRELPAWAIYVRHASMLQFDNLSLFCEKKDYRVAIVLDDVNHARFVNTFIKQPFRRNPFFIQHSADIHIH